MGILVKSAKGAGLLLSVCLLWLCLVGCDGRVAPLPDRLGKAFSAELVWERGGVLLRASVTAGERAESGARELSLCLSAPAELAGVRARQTEAGISMELDGLTFDGLPASGLLLPASLLTAEGPLTWLCDIEEQGRTLRLAERMYEGERVTYYFSARDGIPTRLTWGELSVRILNFEGEA